MEYMEQGICSEFEFAFKISGSFLSCDPHHGDRLGHQALCVEYIMSFEQSYFVIPEFIYSHTL